MGSARARRIRRQANGATSARSSRARRLRSTNVPCSTSSTGAEPDSPLRDIAHSARGREDGGDPGKAESMGVSASDETLTSFQPQSDASPRAGRVNSLDIVRGIIMILMAVDHVRVYAGVPAGGPTPGVFFTRWITHFSAPGFAFLAGTGAFLYGRRLANTGALSRFLLVRGIMLVVLELTVIRLAWTFNTDFAHYNLAGVIWMLGWCMILMAALVHLPTAAIGVIGAFILLDRKSTRLNSSHQIISYAVFCLKKKKTYTTILGHDGSHFFQRGNRDLLLRSCMES